MLDKIGQDQHIISDHTDHTMHSVTMGLGFGLVEGTHIATGEGWTAVEDLQVGQQALTFDAGMQEITAIVHDELWSDVSDCPPELYPLFVPASLIGNREDMLVLPNQGVIIETDVAMDKWGDPFAVVPGAALLAMPGVQQQAPYGSVEVVKPVFAEDQVVFADHGALAFCEAFWGVSAGILPRNGLASNYNMLPLDIARRLIEIAVLQAHKTQTEIRFAAA